MKNLRTGGCSSDELVVVPTSGSRTWRPGFRFLSCNVLYHCPLFPF